MKSWKLSLQPQKNIFCDMSYTLFSNCFIYILLDSFVAFGSNPCVDFLFLPNQSCQSQWKAFFSKIYKGNHFPIPIKVMVCYQEALSTAFCLLKLRQTLQNRADPIEPSSDVRKTGKTKTIESGDFRICGVAAAGEPTSGRAGAWFMLPAKKHCSANLL